MPLPEVLTQTHPTWDALHLEWERDEKRYRAGRAVRDELCAFVYETEGGLSHSRRKVRALAPPLMRTTAERFVGALFDEAPEPDFGSLGEVRQERSDTPTRAEMVFDAVDGVGYAARGWDAFWREEDAKSTATGFRWILCDAPPGGAGTVADEIDGQRPYLVAYSPTAVPDWHYERGILQYARIVEEAREPRVEDGHFTTKPRTRHLLLVRAGYGGLGAEYQPGGWWLYEDDGDLVDSGDWSSTGGEIPMWRLIYDADGEGLSDLGAVQVVIMDLLSGLYHDGMIGGGHGVTVAGVDAEQAKALATSYNEGSRIRYIPAREGATGQPTIHDDAAASASDAIVVAIEKHLEIAQDVIMRELVTAPDASGAAKALEFVAGASPRLTSMAMSIEESQCIAIHFLQLRFGLRPTGNGVTWPKRFDLRAVATKVLAVLDVFTQAGVKPPPAFTSELIGGYIEREGLMGQADPEVLKADIAAGLSAGLRAATAQADVAQRRAQPPGSRVAGLLGALGGDGETGEPPVSP